MFSSPLKFADELIATSHNNYSKDTIMKYIQQNWIGKMENVGERESDCHINLDNRFFNLSPYDKGDSFLLSIVNVLYFCNSVSSNIFR